MENKDKKDFEFLSRKRHLLLKGSRSIESYEYLNKIDEGAYGVVFRAKNKDTGEIVAIKLIKLAKETEGFPITSIREINTMLNFENENIISMREILYGHSIDKVYCIMEYMDYELKSLLTDKKYILEIKHVKCLIKQLLQGVEYMHDHWVLHRDLKTSNLLLNKEGILKIGDFGLARRYGSPVKAYTKIVVTLWYRAPELLLSCEKYGTAIDMWSVGCILAELVLREAIFQGENELDQLNKIFKIMTTPNEDTFPGWNRLPNAKMINFKQYTENKLKDKFKEVNIDLTEQCLDLLNKLLAYDPNKRITAKQALKHKFFDEEPMACEPSELPKFPELNDKTRQELKKLKKNSVDAEQRTQRDKKTENEILSTNELRTNNNL